MPYVSLDKNDSIIIKKNLLDLTTTDYDLQSWQKVDILNKSVLRQDVAYFDCPIEILAWGWTYCYVAVFLWGMRHALKVHP